MLPKRERGMALRALGYSFTPKELDDVLCREFYLMTEEERRLFFVGMTRAREELILSCPGAPSRFAGELGDGLVQEVAKARVRPPKVEQLSMF